MIKSGDLRKGFDLRYVDTFGYLERHAWAGVEFISANLVCVSSHSTNAHARAKKAEARWQPITIYTYCPQIQSRMEVYPHALK